MLTETSFSVCLLITFNLNLCSDVIRDRDERSELVDLKSSVPSVNNSGPKLEPEQTRLSDFDRIIRENSSVGVEVATENIPNSFTRHFSQDIYNVTASEHHRDDHHHRHDTDRYSVARLDFESWSVPFYVTVWLLSAAFAKISKFSVTLLFVFMYYVWCFV